MWNEFVDVLGAYASCRTRVVVGERIVPAATRMAVVPATMKTPMHPTIRVRAAQKVHTCLAIRTARRTGCPEFGISGFEIALLNAIGGPDIGVNNRGRWIMEAVARVRWRERERACDVWHLCAAAKVSHCTTRSQGRAESCREKQIHAFRGVHQARRFRRQRSVDLVQPPRTTAGAHVSRCDDGRCHCLPVQR